MKTKLDVIAYADMYLDSKQFDDYIQDAYWRDSFDADKVIDLMLTQAQKDKVTLLNLDDSYTELYKLIKIAKDTAEVGLS